MDLSEDRYLLDSRSRLSRRLRQGRVGSGGQSPGDDGLLAEAANFVALFHSENPAAGSADDRMRQIRREIASTGTYRHTEAELTFAAQVAWRNSSRCIGRLYWRSLRVRDRRHVSSAADIAAESVAHLRAATNGGRIRPLITVFAPDAPGRPGPRILGSQLVRYAGYEDASAPSDWRPGERRARPGSPLSSAGRRQADRAASTSCR